MEFRQQHALDGPLALGRSKVRPQRLLWNRCTCNSPDQVKQSARKKGSAKTSPTQPPAKATPPAAVSAPFAPAVLALLIFALAFIPRVQQNTALVGSFFGAAAFLMLANIGLLLATRKQPAQGVGRLLLIPPRAQHYVQASVQFSVYIFWGWFWPPVADFAPLLVAQFLFAYALWMLVSWYKGESYALGFGPFPILFSINLFLWFRDDWFYLQFLLVAAGIFGKEFVKWNRDGKKVHIFNPSAFPLALASIILIATGTTHLTWGPEIAATLGMGPHIYKLLFLSGLVVMFFFNITLITACAAATLFGLSALYQSVTGVPYFLDSEIPSAVFLGMLLLVTDPSTSPRTALGKAIFGTLYGLGVFALYSMLGAIGAPTFYDKLLCVPLLNLCVRGIESFTRNLKFAPTLSHLLVAPIPRKVNVSYMAAWALFFATMTAVGRTDGRHTGDSLPFWQQACEEGRATACERLLRLETTYCNDNSGWACNELGVQYREGMLAPAEENRALAFLSKGCELRFQAACLNLLEPTSQVRAAPRTFDLRLLLREGGPNLMDMPEGELISRACEHNWTHTCRAVAVSR